MDNILIWDLDKAPLASNASIVLWRAFSDDTVPHAVSIPTLIEANADSLKAQYLAYIYELGELHIQGIRLIDHLALRSDFSAWWLSLIVEKCNWYKSAQIDDAIRMLAFVGWVGNRTPARITLVSDHRALAETVQLWCKHTGVIFKWQREPKLSAPMPWPRKIYVAMPGPVQALAFLLRYLNRRRHLCAVGIDAWRQTQGDITFVSYLFNLVPEAEHKNRFASRYWNHLPEVLISQLQKTNWLHLYVKDALLPDEAKAADTLRRFNQTGQDLQHHLTLDSFIRITVVLRAVRDWIILALKALGLGFKLRKSSHSYSYIFPLLASDWHKSFFGVTAINNLLSFNLFEEAMRALPRQRIGFYLQENQAWELAFIQAWRAAGHGTLIGVPHATVRFWDLCYFSDKRAFQREKKTAMPMPDAVALNGIAATNAYLSGAYPKEQIVQVEALRYQYLASANSRKRLSISPHQPLQLLVLGDCLESNTNLQLCLLEEAVSSLAHDLTITFKPHPLCPVTAEDYPGLRLHVVVDPIEQLITECHAAYASSETSAAVDAYLSGVPVVSILDPRQINRNPLRGYADVYFVSCAVDLIKALKAIMTTPPKTSSRQEFFTLDKDLPRWRKLILDSKQNFSQFS